MEGSSRKAFERGKDKAAASKRTYPQSKQNRFFLIPECGCNVLGSLVTTLARAHSRRSARRHECARFEEV